MTTAALQIEAQPESPIPQLQVLPSASPSNGHPESSIQHPGSHPAPIQQSNNPVIQPSPTRASKPKVRNGKIARLPFLERDIVNRMLRDHIPYESIVGALDEHGIRVTQRNVSNWKTRGGYKEWAAEQDRALTNRLTQDNILGHLRKTDASQLPEVGLQIAATNLSQFFLKPETQASLATNPNGCHQTITDICRLARHIQALQKYRDETAKELGYKSNPERVRREEEKAWEITREIYSAAEIPDDPRRDPIPRRNYIPKELAPRLPDDPDEPSRTAELLSLIMGTKPKTKPAA
jgi:hypothetical protein